MKKVTYYTFFLCCFLILNFLCKQATGDFSIHFLEQTEPAGSKWETHEVPTFLKNLLTQEFTYLGKGKQAYVFLSQDKEHVLKVFKPLAPYFRLSFFGKKYKVTCSQIPLAKQIFKFLCSEECAKAKDYTFQSYLNAFTFLKEETQIEYLHLTKTETDLPTLTIYDAIGVVHALPLNSTSFLIQKKTELFYPRLAHAIENKEISFTKELLSNFVDFYLCFTEKGVVNPSCFEGNIGCIGSKIVQIDVGRVFRKQDLDPTLKEEDFRIPKNQILQNTKHLKKWLSQKAPELCDYVEELEKKHI